MSSAAIILYYFAPCVILQGSSQLEALEGSQGVTALSVGGDLDGPGRQEGGGGDKFFSRGGGSDGIVGKVAGGGSTGDDQAVASSFRILKVIGTRGDGGWLPSLCLYSNINTYFIPVWRRQYSLVFMFNPCHITDQCSGYGSLNRIFGSRR